MQWQVLIYLVFFGVVDCFVVGCRIIMNEYLFERQQSHFRPLNKQANALLITKPGLKHRNTKKSKIKIEPSSLAWLGFCGENP